jgi:phosphate transport system substrate-binding protein
MWRGTSLATLLTVLSVMLAACSGRHGDDARGGSSSEAGSLTIKGSDTMVILAQRWSEAYMRAHSGTTIQVSGGGSGTGIAALINGNTDLATASRPIRDSERATIRERRGADVHETRVALDALAVYVNEANALREITMPELALVFRGRTTRWSELGGPDRRIILYSRENNSGTYAYFKEHVLENLDFAASAQTLPGTSAVIHAVARDRYSIGYGGIGYGQGARTLAIAPAEGEPAVPPTLENATQGTYPLARFLYIYTVGEPTGLAAAFLEFARSAEGQALVEATGFYPLPDARTAERAVDVETPTLAEAR